MLRLIEAGNENRELLWNILQKYLYEMSRYYGDEMDENGVYPYRYFDAYFTEARRRAYLLYEGEALVGFALVNPYSYLGKEPDYVMAEFSIFPLYRKQKIGRKAAELIFGTLKGKWELKYSDENGTAKNFWNCVTDRYKPMKHCCGDGETVLEFSTD